jgi:hypothetical protein
MEWRDIYIFISSTFNDMHAERDFLVKEIFPELTEWCETKKLRIVDIDLRWGITSADSEAKNTVTACLENIDRCRPFFLCFLGQRRGWVPNDPLRYSFEGKNGRLSQEQLETGTLGEISMSSYAKYDKLKTLDGKTSVTEMEIEHALLSPMLNLKPSDRALFFFRKHNFDEDGLTDKQRMIYLNDELKKYEADPKIADEALAKFKEKVHDSGRPVIEYTCKWDSTVQTPELLAEENGEEIAQGRLVDFKVNDADLKDVVIEQLKIEIRKQFPDRVETPAADVIPKTPFEIAYQNDLEQQQLFVRLNSDGYIPRDEIIRKLDDYINDDSNDDIFLLTAKAGLGKSMLLANYVNRVNDKRTVYARFCGVSDLSSEEYSLWKSIFHEANIAVPDIFDELRKNMSRLLEELSQKGRSIIIIDAINQIRTGLEMFAWLPRKLPANIKLLVSIKEDDENERFIQSLNLGDNNRLSLPSFKGKKKKKRLINEFLKRYFKALDNVHIKIISRLSSSDNPLFLKILLHELRVFGAFKQLKTQIKHYGKRPQDAFAAMLERLETEHVYNVVTPQESVPFLFGLLALHIREKDYPKMN